MIYKEGKTDQDMETSIYKHKQYKLILSLSININIKEKRVVWRDLGLLTGENKGGSSAEETEERCSFIAAEC